MNSRRIGAIILGIALLIVFGYSMYKLAVGKEIGFNEILAIATLTMVFFSTITWGTKEEKDGILQEEELGQRITEKSAKISYYLLLVFIFIAVSADKIINGTANIFLILILGLAMITHPIIEYFYSKKYQ